MSKYNCDQCGEEFDGAPKVTWDNPQSNADFAEVGKWKFCTDQHRRDCMAELNEAAGANRQDGL